MPCRCGLISMKMILDRFAVTLLGKTGKKVNNQTTIISILIKYKIKSDNVASSDGKLRQ